MIKIFECKLCDFKGIRPSVRKHIREDHLIEGKTLSELTRSKEFK